LTRSAAPITASSGRCVKRRSELALSEAEGVNPEQVEGVDIIFRLIYIWAKLCEKIIRKEGA